METEAYKLGIEIGTTGWISKAERKQRMLEAGLDVATDSADVLRGIADGKQIATDARRSKLLATVGDRAVWHVTAEHTNGKSVEHPCSTGLYTDPANTLDMYVAGGEIDDAESLGVEELKRMVAVSKPCDCRRAEKPGTSAWWDSVCVTASPMAVEELIENDVYELGAVL